MKYKWKFDTKLKHKHVKVNSELSFDDIYAKSHWFHHTIYQIFKLEDQTKKKWIDVFFYWFQIIPHYEA